MSDIDTLAAERASKLDRMDELVQQAENRGTDLTRSEAQEWENLDRAVVTINAQISSRSLSRSRPLTIYDNNSDFTTGSRMSSVAAEFRDITTGSNTAHGSSLVPSGFGRELWDRLAETAVAIASGTRVIKTEFNTLRIPKLTADATATWMAEAGTITPSDPTFADLTATPRKLAALTVLSSEVVMDSAPPVLEIVTENLARSLALKIDKTFYEGSGTAPEPRGLKNTAGIQTLSLGTNGGVPTNLDPFADAIGLLAQANAKATAIIMHPRTWQTLSKVKELSSGSNKPVLQEAAGSGSQAVQRSIYGVPVWLTGQLSITETQGTSTDCSSVYVYQADQTVIVRRQDIRVEVDRSRLFNSDQLELRAIARLDVAIPNAVSVVRVTGVRP